MSAGLSDGDFTRILTETPEGQRVLKAFFDSWNQSHETDIIKKFQIALLHHSSFESSFFTMLENIFLNCVASSISSILSFSKTSFPNNSINPKKCMLSLDSFLQIFILYFKSPLPTFSFTSM